jgi:hypothetical protein
MSKLRVNQIEPLNGSTVTVLGNLSATRFLGDGSQLTGITGGTGTSGTSGTSGSSGTSGGNFTGNTSANCITNIWIQNLNGCNGILNINGNLDVSGSASASTFYGDGSNLTGINNRPGTVEATPVTYSAFTTILNSEALVPGAAYIITDYQACYDQPDYDYSGNAILTGNYRQGPVEPLMVFAVSGNQISNTVYSYDYPKDRIQYDWTWNTTEITNSPAKGRITERIDEFNNRTDYDHRAIKFKRYTTHFTGNRIGVVTGVTYPYVYGSSTNFLNSLFVDDVIFIESDQPTFYRVSEIISDTELVVHGYAFFDFTNQYGYDLHRTSTRTSDGTDGTLYYFNDVGNDNINDGGDDMYDGANEINTNLFNQIPYTHTQMIDPPVDDNNQAQFNDFVMDGTVQSGDTYFGSSSLYFTNCYPGLFVMAATGVTIDYFEITGNLGSDGDGQADVFDYTLNYGGKDWSVYCKRVWDAGDPSVNHMFIVDTINPNIVHTADLSTEDDDDRIEYLTGVTQVHYLLMGLKGGVKMTNTQIQDVVTDYLSLVSSDINVTLSNLNTSFTAVTSNVPAYDGGGIVSLEYKQNNFSGDTNYVEHYTFSQINSYQNNYIGDFARYFNDGNDYDFMLSNNVFTNSDDNIVDVFSNNFNDICYNNTFGDDVRGNLVMAPSFNQNTFYDRFGYNLINRNFSQNIWYDGEFNNNKIWFSFFGNKNVGNDFRDNDIGSSFGGNVIRGGFNDNIVGDDFNSNQIFNNFDYNQISLGCSYNTFRGNFDKNKVGTGFYGGQLWSNVEGNSFGNDCNNNIIGTAGLVNSYSFRNNTFGNNCYSNVFSGHTENNVVGNYFYTNTVDNNFSYNNIGNYFNNNSIKEGFGFGFSTSQGNVIGNYFYSNSIGEYFYNNRICDGFYNNSIGDYFQNNYVKIPSLNNVNFKENYGNITSFTYVANGTGATFGTYFGLNGITNGQGQGASFDVDVVLGAVTNVALNSSGNSYSVNDTITILGSQIGGDDGVDDITITVTDLNQTPSVYESYTCELFANLRNIPRLSFYDGNDVLTIKNINE